MYLYHVGFLDLPAADFQADPVTDKFLGCPPPFRKNDIFLNFHHRMIKVSFKCLIMHYVSDPHKHFGVHPIIFHCVRRKL